MGGSDNVVDGTSLGHDRVTKQLEDLDLTLQQISNAQSSTDDVTWTVDSRASATSGATEHRVDPDQYTSASTARLVGDEVASILDAAEVVAERIRARAWDVAAEVQRQIRDMQGTLARLALEMSDLLKTGDPRTSVTAPVVGAERSEVDLAVVLDEGVEEPSSSFGRSPPAELD